MLSNTQDKYAIGQKVVLFQLYFHCQLMYDYLTETGKKVPEDIGNVLAEINLKTHPLYLEYNRQQDKQKFSTDLEFEFQTKVAAKLESDRKKLIKIFNILVKLSKPASPCTLENTIPAWKIFIWIGQRCAPFACFTYWNGIIYLVGYILTVGLLLAPLLSVIGIKLSPEFNLQLILFFSAGLGASLYAILTSKKYLLNRTFDNKYIPHYVNRVLVGIMTGFILSNLLTPAFLTPPKGNGNGSAPPFNILSQLTPSMIALLGGFSAEVVIQILKRIVAMIRALFEGDTKEVIESTEQKIRAKMDAERVKRNLNYVVELRSKLDESGLNRETPGFKKLDEVINKIKDDEEIKIEEEPVLN